MWNGWCWMRSCFASSSWSNYWRLSLWNISFGHKSVRIFIDVLSKVHCYYWRNNIYFYKRFYHSFLKCTRLLSIPYSIITRKSIHTPNYSLQPSGNKCNNCSYIWIGIYTRLKTWLRIKLMSNERLRLCLFNYCLWLNRYCSIGWSELSTNRSWN